MNKPDNHIDSLGAILRHYREFADMAWSEVTDKVYTVDEYHKALDKLTKDHVKLIEDFYRNKILEARKDEVEGFMKLHTAMQPDSSGSYLWLKSRLNDITAQFNGKGDK